VPERTTTKPPRRLAAQRAQRGSRARASATEAGARSAHQSHVVEQGGDQRGAVGPADAAPDGVHAAVADALPEDARAVAAARDGGEPAREPHQEGGGQREGLPRGGRQHHAARRPARRLAAHHRVPQRERLLRRVPQPQLRHRVPGARATGRLRLPRMVRATTSSLFSYLVR
jgi:hypothetical protein